MELENYPSNTKKAQLESNDRKKVQPVVSGAKIRKKSSGRRIADIFVPDDMEKVKSYILDDVLIPAIKHTIDDLVTNGIGMILYGTARGGRNDKDYRTDYRSYDRYYRDDRDSSHVRRGLDYDEVICPTRSKAQHVLDCLEDMIYQYGSACIADLYELAGIPSGNNYTYNNYGWTDIHSGRVILERDGFLIKLPRPVPLNSQR